MLLSQILAGVPLAEKLSGDTEISAVELDSRKTVPGALFIALNGKNSDGRKFIPDALEKGAAAVLYDGDYTPPAADGVLFVRADGDMRQNIARAAANFYKPVPPYISAVTGTNGKTSTTYMIKSIAEEAGLKVGLIGTIHNLIGDRILETERTTPASVDLQKILRDMKNAGVELVVMEVSSHALDQARVHGVEFDIGIFTNLTQDHLDYHKTFDNYLAAKKKLFLQSKRAVVNADDPHFASITEGLDIPLTTFGIREKADFSANDIEITTAGAQFAMRTPEGSINIKISIPGLFSVFNALGAAAACMLLGFDADDIREGLAKLKSVSGRLEPLPTDGDYSVLLDYAHTPDALENVLRTVRGFARGRVVTLFGCGGNRDKAKRPIMGEIAGRYSDFLIVTSDNPRNEEPMSIIESVVEGVNKSGCPHVVIEDRRAAIKYALENAKEKDVIVLAGKGHENYQEIGGGKRHFDEKEIVAELLEELDRR